MPGTNVSLGDGFTVYFLDQALPSPRNRALHAAGDDLCWKGDVVVLKNVGETGVGNITEADFSLIEDVLHRCVYNDPPILAGIDVARAVPSAMGYYTAIQALYLFTTYNC
jgi:hypothetical protein